MSHPSDEDLSLRTPTGMSHPTTKEPLLGTPTGIRDQELREPLLIDEYATVWLRR